MLCGYCRENAQSNCSDCHLFPYCCPNHFEYHRFDGKCLPFKIDYDEQKGHHMVATRNIRAMEVILEEYPVFHGPYVKSLPQCLECFKPIADLDNTFRCAGCRFPMCGPPCSESSKVHSKTECRRMAQANLEIQTTNQVLRKKKKENMDQDEELDDIITFDYSVVNVLRGLELKATKPDVWIDIMRLVDHNEQRKQEGNPTWQLWMTEVIPRLEEHFPKSDIQDALRILGIGITNSANLNLRNGGRGTGLYPTFARINHRCICNTKSIKHSDQKLQVRASFPILAGEEITSQYVKPLNGTAIRKFILRSKWYFECECPRCADPTELGSYLSAFTCTKCKHGTVLSKEPLNPDALWSCQNCSSESSVDRLQTYLDRCIEEVRASEPQTNLIHHYEECLHKFSTTLHPGHQILTDINSQLAILYGSPAFGGLTKMTRPELDRKIQVCHQVLDTNGKVDPGYSIWRAKMLVQMTQTKVHVATRDFKAGFINEDQLENVLREEKFLRVYLAYYQSVFMGY